MQDDFLMFGSDEMVYDMGSRCIASRVAKPLGTNKTLNNRSWRVDSTVAKKITTTNC